MAQYITVLWSDFAAQFPYTGPKCQPKKREKCQKFEFIEFFSSISYDFIVASDSEHIGVLQKEDPY